MEIPQGGDLWRFLGPGCLFDREEMIFFVNFPIHHCHGNPQPSLLGVIHSQYIGGVKPSFFMVLGSKGGFLVHMFVSLRIRFSPQKLASF